MARIESTPPALVTAGPGDLTQATSSGPGSFAAPAISFISLGDRRKSAAFPGVVVVLTFIAIVWFGTSGVRGSDQFWYVADVESLIEGRGVQTNEIYPVSVLHGSAPPTRPFVHNLLNLYVVAVPALLFGAYGGWIAVNLVSGFLAAFLIFCTVVKVGRSTAAALAASAAYLLLPLTTWLTMQPLVEASIAPLVALAVYLYVTASAAYGRWMLLTLLVALLVFCRETFVLLLPLVPLAYLVHVRPLDRRRLVAAAGLLAFGGALWLLGASLFEPYLSVPYTRVLTSPGPEDMNWFFDLNPEPLSISAIFAKAIRGLADQVAHVDVAYLLFYLPFNLMVVAPLVLLRERERGESARVGIAGLVLVALHLTTAVIVQNQFRYLMVATPPLLMAAGVVLARSRRFRAIHMSKAMVLTSVLVLAVPSVALAWHSHEEGRSSREARDALARALDETLPTDDTVMVALKLGSGLEYQMLGYVMRPRRTLYVSDDYGAGDYAALIHNADAEWLMSRRDSPILGGLAAGAVREVRSLPAPFAEWSLFSIGVEAAAF